jgi:hypothetical protein
MKNETNERGLLWVIAHVFLLYFTIVKIPVMFKELLINLNDVSSVSAPYMEIMFIIFTWMTLVVVSEMLWFVLTIARKFICKRWDAGLEH